MARQPKPITDTFELCDMAARIVRKVGFEHYCTSRKSEAAYYYWPGHAALLRIAAHRQKTPTDDIGNIVSRLTFNDACTRPGHMRLSAQGFELMISRAIGRYFIKVANIERQPDGWLR